MLPYVYRFQFLIVARTTYLNDILVWRKSERTSSKVSEKIMMNQIKKEWWKNIEIWFLKRFVKFEFKNFETRVFSKGNLSNLSKSLMNFYFGNFLTMLIFKIKKKKQSYMSNQSYIFSVFFKTRRLTKSKIRIGQDRIQVHLKNKILLNNLNSKFSTNS